MLEATQECSIFFVLADGPLLGDADNGDGKLRERCLETEKERECECLGVKKFQMGRSFVLADGSSLGDAGSGDGGEGEAEGTALGDKERGRV